MLRRKPSNRFLYLEELLMKERMFFKKETTNEDVFYTIETKKDRVKDYFLHIQFTYEFDPLFSSKVYVDQKIVYTKKNKIIEYINMCNDGDGEFYLDLKENQIWAMDFHPEIEDVFHVGDTLEPRQVLGTITRLDAFVAQQELAINVL